jgi:polyisoprenyl-phosphate glycosyltransferase
MVPRMIELWRDGYEVVNAVRRDRSSDSRAKRTTARAFYKLVNRISDTTIPADVGDFRLLDRAVVEAIKLLPERVRFNKGLFSWVGFRQANIEYVRPPRVTGASKFGYWRLWNFALDGIISFSSVPLRIWSYLGLTVAFGSLAYAVLVVIRTLLTGVDVPGYASTVVLISFFSGINMLGLGILGEYVGRIYIETKNRPLYVLRRVYRPEDFALPAAREVIHEAAQ